MNVLLTGASGILGQALLPRLQPSQVTCLVHRTSVRAAGVGQLSGDILEPELGLTPRQADDLAGKLDWVVHCAAETNFSENESDVFRLNVDGTRNVARLARRTGARLCHISTAFVRHADPGVRGPKPNAYARSKAEAETVIGASGAPFVIVRPSRIVGESRTGAISRFQGFHLLFDLLLRGDTLVSSASPDAWVDFVPVDFVAEAIALILDRDAGNEVYWLTAGERALTLRRTVDVEIEELSRLTGRKPAAPLRVSEEEYESQIKPQLFAAVPSELHPVLDGFIQMMDSLNLEPFPSSNEKLAYWGLRSMPDPEATLRRNLLYWARRRGVVRLNTSASSRSGGDS